MRNDAYPHPVQDVTLVETHISWVLLTGDFAYKIKRPVRYAFVDLTSAARRAFFCEEELRLNRRFAPDLYLDVCDITQSPGGARIGSSGPPIERCVRMRQFPAEEELDRLLEAGRIEPAALEEFGRDLAHVHSRLPVVDVTQRFGLPREIRQGIFANLDEYVAAAAAAGAGGGVNALRAAFEKALNATEDCMTLRRLHGRVRECHGDLHTRNIVRRESRLVGFDCIEFEPAFRWIDVAEEIALLLADLESRGYPMHAHAFLAGYLCASGDYEALRVLNLYKAHRAVVRAKVAALEIAAAADERTAGNLRARHDVRLHCAQEALAPKSPQLILMSGLSGSGKTWLARRLAPVLHAIHVRSDVERKRGAGLPEHADSGSATGSGLYSAASTAQLYQRLAACAQDVLAGGYSLIVDATFSRRSTRALFQQLARRLHVPLRVIRCEAPPDVLRERITQRKRSEHDASEADLAVLEWQLRHDEPIAADEALDVVTVDTTSMDPAAEALRQLGKAGAS